MRLLAELLGGFTGLLAAFVILFTVGMGIYLTVLFLRKSSGNER